MRRNTELFRQEGLEGGNPFSITLVVDLVPNRSKRLIFVQKGRRWGRGVAVGEGGGGGNG